MRLPVLNNSPAFGKEIRSCKDKDYCSTCKLYEKNGGRCGGCSSTHKQELIGRFGGCYGECHTCTGYKVDVTAICCRSPLKDAYLTAVTKGAKDWNHPNYKYTARPRISLKDRAIFYISSGGVNTIAPGAAKLIEGVEAVAVNLSRVWGSNGFYSKDLKDYLHLQRSTKLILMTMVMDDLLERAWTKEFYADPSEYEKVGLDYWMPLSFSGYREEAHMHQLYQTYRTLLCTERSQAWWVTGDHWFPSVKTDEFILEAAEKIPQLIFNTQFATGDSLRFHVRQVKHYHELLPESVAFWLVGQATPTFMHNIRKVAGKRDIYYLSAKPLYLASKGQLLSAAGASKKVGLPKIELLHSNFANLNSMVKEYG